MPDDRYMPRFRFNSVCEITVDDIEAMGVDALLLDIDNTLIYDETLTPLPGAKAWVESMQAAGVPLIIVSNAILPRVCITAKLLRIKLWLCSAKKPKPDAIHKAAKILNTPVERLAMVGDRIKTDVLAANTAGAVAVFVNPAKPEVLFKAYNRKQRRGEDEILAEFERRKGD